MTFLVRWLCVLLARMKVPEILPVLENKIGTEEDRGYFLADYFYALVLLGTYETYAVIKHHAEESTGIRQGTAKRMLKRFPSGPSEVG